MTPLVTIGIPAYNSDRWIRQAIESALAQGPRCEVIVVNDRSTDNTSLFASAFGDHIILLRNIGHGANVARNRILKESHAEWIQYLDADDYLLPNKIEQQLLEADGGAEADVIYSPVIVEETHGEPDASTFRTTSELHVEYDLFSQWISWELPQTGGALWRRGALESLNGWRPDQPCCQEHELYMRALQAGLRFQRTKTPGAVYRIWSNDTLCRKDPARTVRVRTKLIDHMREWLQYRKQWTEQHQALAGRACFEMARTLAKTNISEAVDYYRDRQRAGLLLLEGPAAPKAYRVVHDALGFSTAEIIARILR
jgi:glycosyltransferase involved in cell wall biosynthesis